MGTATLVRPPTSTEHGSDGRFPLAWVGVTWAVFVVGAVLALDVVDLTTWGWTVPLAAAVLVAVTAPAVSAVAWVRSRVDGRDLAVVAVSYLAVVGLYRLAFVGFGQDRVLGLFLSFAGGLLIGVVGPVVYTVWVRGRTLRSLGIGRHNWRSTLALGGVLAAVQFAMTLWGVQLPEAVDWVPLLVESLLVGLFEAIFFRGFVQGRLEDSFGAVAGVAGAAGLYALYHVGYGMEPSEMVFLFGLGVVYAIAYRITGNLLVLWPLLTPMGAFFNNLEAGGFELPWASILGFVDVLGVMAAALWFAARRERRLRTPA